MTRLVIAGAALVATACAAGAAVPVRISLAAKPPSVIAGRAWTVTLTARPRSFAGVVRVSAAGSRRLSVRAAGGHGTYRARLVFPAAGRWTLSATAGTSTSRLGTIAVRPPAPKPLTFTWPTSIDVQQDGSLLVVENGAGRVDRVQPATGRTATVASGLAKPYAVATTPSGTIYLSNGNSLQRIDRTAAPMTVVDAGAEIGPVAVAPNGGVFYTTTAQVVEVGGGVIASGLSAPHGVAVAADSAVLVCDTGNGRVLRIDPQTQAATALIRTGEPRGIDVAGDGSLYVVEAVRKRIGHYTATGTHLGDVGPVFNDPYDVEVGAGGTVFVLETAESGTIRRVAPDGSVSTLSTG
ncbi:MAG: NHL repeat-containing protein [Gaiellaceae bacterium]